MEEEIKSNAVKTTASLLCKDTKAVWLLLGILFLLPDVKFRVKCIEVFGVQMFFYNI